MARVLSPEGEVCLENRGKEKTPRGLGLARRGSQPNCMNQKPSTV